MDPALVLFGQSLLIGVSIAAPVGQIGVLAIQRTLERGAAAGIATGLGAALADAVYGAIGAFGVVTLIAWLVGMRTWLSLFGSLFLFWLAWRIARKPVIGGTAAAPEGRSALWSDVAGTFALTLANPTTILSFIAVFGAIAGRTAAASPWAMVAGVLAGSMLWWLLLAGVVGRVRERFDARWQRAVNLCSAFLLAGFGVWQIGRLLA